MSFSFSYRSLLPPVLALTLMVPHPTVAQVPHGQGAVLALEAARKDAYRVLLETVEGFQLDARSTVRNLAMESSEIRASLDSFVRGAQIVDERLEVDGTATVELMLDLDRLEELLGRRIRVELRRIRATGRGAAPTAPAPPVEGRLPPAQIRPAHPEIGHEVIETLPEYSAMVTVVGRAAVRQSRGQTDAQARLMAETAARQDAYRRLLEYVHGISISASTTVRDLCLESDVVRSRVNAYVQGAEVGNTTFLAAGVAEVEVSLDLSGLSGVFR